MASNITLAGASRLPKTDNRGSSGRANSTRHIVTIQQGGQTFNDVVVTESSSCTTSRKPGKARGNMPLSTQPGVGQKPYIAHASTQFVPVGVNQGHLGSAAYAAPFVQQCTANAKVQRARPMPASAAGGAPNVRQQWPPWQVPPEYYYNFAGNGHYPYVAVNANPYWAPAYYSGNSTPSYYGYPQAAHYGRLEAPHIGNLPASQQRAPPHAIGTPLFDVSNTVSSSSLSSSTHIKTHPGASLGTTMATSGIPRHGLPVTAQSRYQTQDQKENNKACSAAADQPSRQVKVELPDITLTPSEDIVKVKQEDMGSDRSKDCLQLPPIVGDKYTTTEGVSAESCKTPPPDVIMNDLYWKLQPTNHPISPLVVGTPNTGRPAIAKSALAAPLDLKLGVGTSPDTITARPVTNGTAPTFVCVAPKVSPVAASSEHCALPWQQPAGLFQPWHNPAPSADATHSGFHQNILGIMDGLPRFFLPEPSQTQQDGVTQKARKPNVPYITMIAKAILSDSNQHMRLADMYEYVLDTYPYYRQEDPRRWKNSLRHALSAHPAFVRQGARESKGSFWTIHPSCVDSFKTGFFDSNQAKALVAEYNNKESRRPKTSNRPPIAPSFGQVTHISSSVKRKHVPETASLACLQTPTMEDLPEKRFCGVGELIIADDMSQTSGQATPADYLKHLTPATR